MKNNRTIAVKNQGEKIVVCVLIKMVRYTQGMTTAILVRTSLIYGPVQIYTSFLKYEDI